MKKILSVLIALAMVFSVFGSFAFAEDKQLGTITTIVGDNASKKPAENTIRIGVLSYLSDAKAQTKDYMQIGWESAVRLCQEKGMFPGMNFEFVMFDPGNDGAMDQQRLTELKELGSVAMLHACGDGLTPTSAQWAGVNKYPVLGSPNASTVNTIHNFSNYYWNGGTKMAWSVGKLIAMAAIENGVKTAVYVGKDGSACDDAMNFMVIEGKKLDPEFELIGNYRVNDNDFTSVVSAVMTQMPDMVLEQGAGSTFVSFMQSAQQFGLCDVIDVYDDFAADSATGGPMVEAGTFPFGHIHGVVQLAYWDKEYMVGDMARFLELAYSNPLVSEMKYFVPITSMSCFYTISSLLYALNDCIEAGLDYNDPEVLNTAISNVHWEDSLGEHYYRDFDHQLTNMLWFGTADIELNRDCFF